MSNTTPERVKAIAAHLKSMPDETIQIYIDDAVVEVSELNVPGKYHERLQRYLAAHLASLNVRRATSKTVSDMSISYSSTTGAGLDTTEYGQEYKRLLRKLRGGFLRVM